MYDNNSNQCTIAVNQEYDSGRWGTLPRRSEASNAVCSTVTPGTTIAGKVRLLTKGGRDTTTPPSFTELEAEEID